MKVRLGFVSNSSSSSFTILKKNISPKLVKKIISHRIKARRVGMQCDEIDEWDITVNDYSVYGSTRMDNFDMREFLKRIGVNLEKVEWSN